MHETNLIQQAMEFAKDFHKEHKRISGEGLYEHSHRVYKRLKKEGIKNEKILIAALLHQVLDYPGDNSQVIKEKFGADVLKLLQNYKELSKKSVHRHSPKDFNQNYIIQTFLNLAQDLDVLVIRLADRADNVKTSFVFSKDQRERIAQRALNVYAPIARFLGLSGFVKEMEDEAFKILHPADYFRIENYVSDVRSDIERFFKDTKNFLYQVLSEKNISSEIDSRIKGMYSIYKKDNLYKSKGVKANPSFKHLYDIAALRIVVDSVEECYLIKDIVERIWKVNFDLSDDYIAEPRPSGYRSLHLVFEADPKFNAEVQIKTHQMHEQNEYGLASHNFYKVSANFKDKLKHDPEWLKKLNYWEKEHFVEESATAPKPFSEKIYTFTPKGDIIELERGATPLDFAYAIHAEIGDRCERAFINGDIAKLDTELKDGDMVQIQTSSKPRKPTRDRLKIAKTKRARYLIKKHLK